MGTPYQERIAGLYDISERMCKSGVPSKVFERCAAICQSLWGAYHDDTTVDLVQVNDELIGLHRSLDQKTKQRYGYVQASGDLK